MHRLSACARPLDTHWTRGRSIHLLSLPIKVEFGLIVPIRRTRSSRAARALFSQQSHWKLEARAPSPRASPFCPGLDNDATFGSKSFLRSRLVRSLRGSARRSTEPSIASHSGGITRQDSDQHPTRTANGAEGLTTVIEEDLEDWVDDFEAISLSDLPLGVQVEGTGQAESVVGSSGASQSISTSESDTTLSSPQTRQSQSQAQVQPRPRTTSKTSRRSRKSSRATRSTELQLILEFPFPPTFIPTPPRTAGRRSRTPSSTRLVAEVNPIHDNESIFFDRDPFRAEPIRDQEAGAESSSVNIPDAGVPRVDSSASFYTAHSRSSSPAPSGHVDPLPSPHPPAQQQPSLSPLQLPFPDPSFTSSPQLTHTETPSSTRRSIRTLTRASATLKRFGHLTRDTFLTSIRTPISELGVRRPRRATRVKHVSLDQLPQSSSSHHVLDHRPELPNFQPSAFDLSFPAVETPHVSPPSRTSRVPRAQPSVQSFYASLEEFLTSHHHSDEPNPNRRSRFQSAPTLLLTTERDPKPAEAPSAEVQEIPPTLPPTLPREERPLPPLPREAYDFVDPSTLTESRTVSPATENRYSSIPPSPSWLSRNVHDLEVALAKKAEASSAASSRSAFGSDTGYSSVFHFPKAVQTQTPSHSTTSSSTRLRGQVVLLRGRVNIQDATPRRITLRSIDPSTKTPSEATVVLRTRSRTRRNRSGQTSQPRLACPPNPPVRPRSRTSSVTKATITHYRRSLLETKKKSRAPRKEDPTKFSTGAKVPKARPIPSIMYPNLTFLLITDTLIYSFLSTRCNKPAHRLSCSASGDCPSFKL